MTLAPGRGARTRGSTAAAVAARSGARPAGFSVPQIRLVTVRPRAGARPARARGAPARRPAGRARRGRAPRSPALHAERPGAEHARDRRRDRRPARRSSGGQPASGFPVAWDVSTGQGAKVARHRHRHRDQPSRVADRAIAGRDDFDGDRQPGARPTASGTARTSPRWPARPAATASGWRARACGCQLLVVKPDFSDSQRRPGDRRRRRPRRRRDQHELRHRPGARPQPGRADADRLRVRARRRARGRGRRGRPDRGAGRPGQRAAADRHRPRHRRGQGPVDVTAAERARPRARSPAAARQISMAAYGTYDAGPARPGRAGSSAPSPPATRRARDRLGRLPPRPPCGCRAHVRRRHPLRLRAGHLDGGAEVAAAGGARPPPQPRPHRRATIVRLIKRDRAPARAARLDRRPGLGDPRRRRRADAARRASTAARRSSRVRLLPARTAKPARSRVRWSAADPAPPGVRASGIARFELWRATDGGHSGAKLATTARRARSRLRRGGRYRFYSDRRRPARATARPRRSRPTRGSRARR